MNTNSRAYRDAWTRVREAIAAELAEREIDVGNAALDDLASDAVRAAFGLDEEPE